jgi:RHS repeat-associated protein
MNGNKIAHLTRGGVDMHFWHDLQGNPSFVTYNNKDYWYVYNLQGDVVALVDKDTGTEVVEYRYDAWGKQIGCTGTLASSLGKENPFRYRGYVYDEETGLYYLRNRYYNPDWGRFINADSVIGWNMFAYCVNNPVNMSDPTGLAEIYTQQWLSAYNMKYGSPNGERYRQGKGNIIFPSGDQFKFTWTQIGADYHIDAYLPKSIHSSILATLDKELALRGREWGGDFPISVVLEMFFDDKKGKKSTLYVYAAMEPYPHFGGGSTTISREPGTHVNVWVKNSRQTSENTIGKYNAVVESGPSEFANTPYKKTPLLLTRGGGKAVPY